MSDFDTGTGTKPDNLPMVVTPPAARSTMSRYSLPSSFASQLIASRDRLAVQRVRYRAPAADASRAYLSGGRIAVKRMPAGFNRNLSV